MIVAARQAQTANRNAPRQHRSAVAASSIRSLFAPSICFWMDGWSDPRQYGVAASAATDMSGLAVSITQSTGSLQPLRSVVDSVPGWTFDGVNDRWDTGAINLTGTNKISVIVVNRETTTTTAGIMLEIGAGAAVNGGVQYFRYTATGKVQATTYTGASYNAKDINSSFNSWFAHAFTCDRSLTAVNEITSYEDGVAKAATVIAASDLSANFENRAATIGGWAPSAATFTGSIAQVLVFAVCLTAAQIAFVSTSLRQRAGLPS